MTEEKKEPWFNHMALVTVILAVCATLSTFKGGGFSTQSVINQTLASDQWAFFQAKSTKQNLYQVQLEALELQARLIPDANPAKAEFAKTINEYEKRVARYESEKKGIELKAKEYEFKRDDAKRHSQPFGLAVIFLQIAILLNSIAGLMKTQKIWWSSLPVALIGLILFANGFLLVF